MPPHVGLVECLVRRPKSRRLTDSSYQLNASPPFRRRSDALAIQARDVAPTRDRSLGSCDVKRASLSMTRFLAEARGAGSCDSTRGAVRVTGSVVPRFDLWTVRNRTQSLLLRASKTISPSRCLVYLASRQPVPSTVKVQLWRLSPYKAPSPLPLASLSTARAFDRPHLPVV